VNNLHDRSQQIPSFLLSYSATAIELGATYDGTCGANYRDTNGLSMFAGNFGACADSVYQALFSPT